VPVDAAAALPVPALTADQVIDGALQVRAGQTVLVHGAGGVTGGMLVQLAAHRGARVIATAGADSAGRLATITTDLPDAERGIAMQAVQVVPDGARLAGLVQLLAQGALTVTVAGSFSLERAAAALAQARHGAHGSATVLRPSGSQHAASQR
jgi:NADPH:quinone reductase-like Zn-dependent oxidoreductase